MIGELPLVATSALELLANLRGAYMTVRGVGGALVPESRGETRPRTSPEVFRFVRQQQRSRRRRFAELAMQLTANAGGRGAFRYAPLLSQSAWIPTEPILLGVPGPHLEDDTDRIRTGFLPRYRAGYQNHVRDSADFARGARRMMPIRGPEAESCRSFSDAIIEMERPPEALFVSRPSYALSRVTGEPAYHLEFEAANYFEFIDCGELLGFELVVEFLGLAEENAEESEDAIVAKLEKRLSLRHAAGEWNAVSFRPSIAGVSTLTAFADPESRTYSFPMMSRAKDLGTAAGTLHVIPAGEFQPTTDAPPAWRRHCTLWQTILREFMEELLLVDEARLHGLDMQELATLDVARPLLELIRGGYWKSYFLGIALDPLTLKPEILTASIIDGRRFREAMRSFLPGGKLPAKDSEGTVHRGPDGLGEQMSRLVLTEYRDDERMLPAGSGCIELLMRFSDELVPGLR